MPLVPINITGPTYQSRSVPLSAQETRNMYAHAVDTGAAKSPLVLMPWPGMRDFGFAPGKGRGMREHAGVLYKVTGETLYAVGPGGAHTALGSIPGTARCVLEGIGAGVVVVTQGKAYHYDGATVSEITSSELEMPNSCAHLNSQMIYDGNGGRFGVSQVGDPTTIDPLDYAAAESDADPLIRVYTFDQRLYLMGTKTIETWWNSGTGRPPFDRVEGGIMTVGLAAVHSVSNTDSAMYFLGDDSHVYRVTGSAAQRVTNTAIHDEIASLDGVSDAIGFCVDMLGQQFYCLVLPAADQSYAYSEQTGWSTLSSGGGRTYANSYAYAYRKHLIEDFRSGGIYEWSPDAYDDNGDPQRRVRATGPIHGGLFNAPGRRIEMSRFELIMETGVGAVDGRGEDPQVMLEWSDDGGRTWSVERRGQIGRLGRFQTRVWWTALGSFYERVLRVTVSDPVFVSIHSAGAELEAGV